VSSFKLRGGEPFQVVVTGGAFFGLPDGVFSGPHDLTPVPNQENVWRMGSWPEPLTRTPASQTSITCDGRPIRLNVAWRYDHIWHNGNHGLVGVAIFDGEDEVPIPMVIEDGEPVRKLVLPTRVRVVLPEGHTPGRWTADAYRGENARVGMPGETDSTRAEFIDREAWLWLPRGPALIVARRDGAVMDQWRVDVSGTAVLVLTVQEPVYGKAKFEITTTVPDLAERAQDWGFKVLTEIKGESHHVHHGAELELQPGTYALVAPDDLRAEGVRFAVAGGETTIVRMSVEGVVSYDSTLILELPTPGHAIVPMFWSQYDTHPDKPFGTGKTPFNCYSFDRLPTRQLPRGLLLEGLPKGQEFWLAGVVGVGDRRYALVPQKLFLTDGQKTVTGSWIELRRAALELNLRVCRLCWESPSGPSITRGTDGPTGWWNAVPTGPTRLTVRRSSGEVLHSFETDWEPGDEPVLLPPDVEARLAELGLLR
jgi:hypothetical protein